MSGGVHRGRNPAAASDAHLPSPPWLRARSLGYQVRVGLLNAGCFSTAQYRRRLIVILAAHDRVLPELPHATNVFAGAGGYDPAWPAVPPTAKVRVCCGACSRASARLLTLPAPLQLCARRPARALQARSAAARAGIPRLWRHIVQVPLAAPLPALTAVDVLDDLPAEAADACDDVLPYRAPPTSAFQAQMRAGSSGVSNHCTQRLEPMTLERIE